MRKPASRARRAVAANWPAISCSSPAVSACGSGAPGLNGVVVGPAGVQPPYSGGIGLPPSHGTLQLALRPACAICMPGTAPRREISAASRVASACCASVHSPRHPGVIRATADTWVASVNTMPAPPAACAPRCCTCQSSPSPSVALYWHIGETVMRLRAVTERKVTGSNSLLMRVLLRSRCRAGGLPYPARKPLPQPASASGGV